MYEEPEPQPVESTQPIQPVEDQQAPQSAQPAKKHVGRKILTVLLVLILIGTAAAGAYWWRDKEAKDVEAKKASEISTLQQAKKDLEKQLVDAKAKIANTADKATCSPQSPSDATIENIKASISSGNTAALEGYSAESVNVILAASDGIGAQTPAEAVGSVSSFIGDPTTTTWNFALGSSTLGSYSDGNYSQYFPANAVVGKSSTNKVIAFSFDCNAKISTILMASSADLLQ